MLSFRQYSREADREANHAA